MMNPKMKKWIEKMERKKDSEGGGRREVEIKRRWTVNGNQISILMDWRKWEESCTLQKIKIYQEGVLFFAHKLGSEYLSALVSIFKSGFTIYHTYIPYFICSRGLIWDGSNWCQVILGLNKSQYIEKKDISKTKNKKRSDLKHSPTTNTNCWQNNFTTRTSRRSCDTVKSSRTATNGPCGEII